MGGGVITTFVQSVPNRPKWPVTLDSIHASDIGTDFYISLQPPDLTPRQHFLRLLRWMADAPTPYVLRLEDDAIVNRHILANIRSWPALDDPRFGAGWLFCPLDRPYGGLWDRSELHGSVGVVLPTEDIPRLIPRVERWFEEHERRLSQDIALSRAVWLSGKRLFLHRPALVDHQGGGKSSTGASVQDAPVQAIRTCAGFDGEWLRYETTIGRRTG